MKAEGEGMAFDIFEIIEGTWTRDVVWEHKKNYHYVTYHNGYWVETYKHSLADRAEIEAYYGPLPLIAKLIKRSGGDIPEFSGLEYKINWPFDPAAVPHVVNLAKGECAREAKNTLLERQVRGMRYLKDELIEMVFAAAREQWESNLAC